MVIHGEDNGGKQVIPGRDKLFTAENKLFREVDKCYGVNDVYSEPSYAAIVVTQVNL